MKLPPYWLLVIRSLLFYTGYAFSIIFYGSLCVLCFFLPFHLRSNLIVQWIRFVMWWLQITCDIHAKIEGLENIPSGNGVVVSKHQSSWETFFLLLHFRPMSPVIKKEILKIPFFGWAIRILKPIAIDRGKPKLALKQLLDQGAARLKEGIWVLIFPEGTRILEETGLFNPGGAILAEKNGYPLVPVAHNAAKCWPGRKFIKYPGTIQVKIGPAILPDKNYKEINDIARNWITNAMDSLS